MAQVDIASHKAVQYALARSTESISSDIYPGVLRCTTSFLPLKPSSPHSISSKFDAMRLRFAVRRIIDKMRARNKAMEFPLLDLPNELIALVVEAIDNVATLANLACTSRRVQELTEPVLWRHLLFSDSSSARGIVAAMNSRSKRAEAVMSLNVPCDLHFGPDLAILASIMQTAKNVTEVTVQSPRCNQEDFETAQEWSPMMDALCLPFQRASAGLAAERPLQKLSKLTLHWNGPGSPYWTPDSRSLSIFLSPTLKYLKVSCVNLPQEIFEEIGANERHSLPLKKLILEECNISPQGLRGLLSLPKALEILYLGENVYNQRHFSNQISQDYNHLFHLSAHTTMNALSQQKHSLKFLQYTAARYLVIGGLNLTNQPTRPREPGLDGGFADFEKLESVACRGPCSAFERVVMASVPPPSLRSLIYQSGNPLTLSSINPTSPDAEDIQDHDNYLIARLPFFRTTSAGTPNCLKEFLVVYENRTIASEVFTEHRTPRVRAISQALKRRHGATLTVSHEDGGAYYPPLLYGEPQPTQWLMYEGKSDEFHWEEHDDDQADAFS